MSKDKPYTFCRCQLHPKCPDLTGWCLRITPNDPIETLMSVHRGVVSLYFHKFGEDPHIQADAARRDLYNPLKLATSWLQTAERFLLRGEAIFVNVNGGMMPAKDVTILETVESDKIDWDVQYEDEVITISRWPEGRHYYLCSNKQRIFIPDRYNEYADAIKAAKRYKAKIVSNNC